ncbi:hypothetical protein M426DRAFT_16730 [Hypoxylon sp. CI-4A]|nr:hypothetical protein M426DRAFT_16730 [Hypoxylon sp. CI-4A]
MSVPVVLIMGSLSAGIDNIARRLADQFNFHLVNTTRLTPAQLKATVVAVANEGRRRGVLVQNFPRTHKVLLDAREFLGKDFPRLTIFLDCEEQMVREHWLKTITSSDPDAEVEKRIQRMHNNNGPLLENLEKTTGLERFFNDGQNASWRVYLSLLTQLMDNDTWCAIVASGPLGLSKNTDVQSLNAV